MNSPTWTQRATLYVFRPLVAIDLYRLFRSWGDRGWWSCVATALACERAGRAWWRWVVREDRKMEAQR